MRRLPVFLAIAALAAAGDAPSAPPRAVTAEEAAGSVLDAIRAGDAAALKALSAADQPDPWVVAEELRLRGEGDAASAFATAAPRKSVEGLAAYLEARRDARAEERLRKALEEMNARLGARDWSGAAGLAPAANEPLDCVVKIRLLQGSAIALYNLRKTTEAVEALRRVREAAAALGWCRREAEVCDRLGRAAQGANCWAEALEWHLRAAAVQEEIGDDSGLADSLYHVASSHLSLGRSPAAVPPYLRAIGIYARLGNEERLAGAHHNVALCYMNMSRFHEALDHYRASLRHAEASGDQVTAAMVHQGLAQTHTFLGQDAEALEEYLRSRDAYEKLGHRLAVAVVSTNLGGALAKAGRFEEALAAFRVGLEFWEGAGNRAEAAIVLNNIGHLCRETGRMEEALDFLGRALATFEEMGVAKETSETLVLISDIHRSRGEMAKALELGERAFRLVDVEPKSLALMMAMQNLCQIRFQMGRYAEVLPFARTIVLDASRVTERLGEEEGSSLREMWGTPAGLGALCALRLGDAAELAWFLEQGRAALLHQSVESRAALKEVAISGPAREELDRAAAAERQAVLDLKRVSRGGDREGVRKAKEALEAARKEVESVAAHIRREEKIRASVVLPAVDDLATIQSRLREEEALILYAVTPEEAAALVIDRKRAVPVALLSSARLEEMALSLGAGDPGTDPTERLAELRRSMVDPLPLGEGIRRVLVSPSGALAYLPFALLFQDREVACVPSGTVYGLLLEEARLRGEGVLALGDPDYETLPTESLASNRGSFAARLAPLPGTREEVARVGSVRLLGKDATESGFRREAASRPRWRALHFACHGLVDPERPMQSALALAADPANDGFLTSREIFGCRFGADLVVLSACETGKGKVYRTEGILGLTQAFMTAGAPRVLCSLWKVDDEATQALMVKFYELWNPPGGAGIPAATALRQAQAYVRSQKKWAHPYFWAAWVLWGPGE